MLLIGFPFSSGSGAKTRPAMVVLDSGDNDLVVACVTTQRHSTPYDVSLAVWQTANRGLTRRINDPASQSGHFGKTLIRRKLGQLQPADRASVATVVRNRYGQW